MEAAPPFRYASLEDPENCLRLLKLRPEPYESDGALHGILIPFGRAEAPPYRPVSYTWGAEAASSALLLRTLEDPTWRRFAIRPNLEALLRQVRRTLGATYIWVDAVCINQADNGEKSYQVHSMDKIYRHQQTIVWLGMPSDNSDLALGLIEKFGHPARAKLSDSQSRSGLQEAIEEVVTSHPTESWEALYDLTLRPWFSRRWIVQEFVLSGHSDLWLGDRMQCFVHFAVLLTVLRRGDRNLDAAREHTNYCDLGQGYIHRLTSPHPDPLDRFCRLWQAHLAWVRGDTSDFTLERLLDKFSTFDSYDPRDGIYAFLSMASDVDLSEWLPDYSDTNLAVDVYGKAALHIIRASKSTDIICRGVHDLEFAVAAAHYSTWIPWFGLQTVSFSSTCDNEQHHHPQVREHTHRLQGYTTKSLTTFGQPSRRLREGEPGWRNHPACDGCDRCIHGSAGLRCLDCVDFDYCYICAKTSNLTHDPNHRFELYNGLVYFASGSSTVILPLPERKHNSLRFRGWLVDTIRDRAPGVPQVSRKRGTASIAFPLAEWAKLRGMEEHVDEDSVPDEVFCRTITGNRRVVDGTVRYATASWIAAARRPLASVTAGIRANELGESRQQELATHTDMSIHESIDLMISNQRTLATTEKSLGMVPVRAQPGGRVAILAGCSVPVVLRSLGQSDGTAHWCLIGECYIDGIMDGEFVETLGEGTQMQEINLV